MCANQFIPIPRHDGATYHWDWSFLFHFKVFHQRDEEDAKGVADPVQRQVANKTENVCERNFSTNFHICQFPTLSLHISSLTLFTLQPWPPNPIHRPGRRKGPAQAVGNFLKRKFWKNHGNFISSSVLHPPNQKQIHPPHLRSRFPFSFLPFSLIVLSEVIKTNDCNWDADQIRIIVQIDCSLSFQ